MFGCFIWVTSSNDFRGIVYITITCNTIFRCFMVEHLMRRAVGWYVEQTEECPGAGHSVGRRIKHNSTLLHQEPDLEQEMTL